MFLRLKSSQRIISLRIFEYLGEVLDDLFSFVIINKNLKIYRPSIMLGQIVSNAI